MNVEHKESIVSIVAALVLTSLIGSAFAQEVSIPDPGLNAAIREALQKPEGPLNEQPLLSLTVLEARNRDVRSVEGPKAARNLIGLRLDSNSLTNFAHVGALTDLETLNLFHNHLRQQKFFRTTSAP